MIYLLLLPARQPTQAGQMILCDLRHKVTGVEYTRWAASFSLLWLLVRDAVSRNIENAGLVWNLTRPLCITAKLKPIIR